MNLKWTNQLEFKTFLHNKPLPDNWEELLFYAEAMIDYVTLGRIKSVEDQDVMDVTTLRQELKWICCRQAICHRSSWDNCQCRSKNTTIQVT